MQAQIISLLKEIFAQKKKKAIWVIYNVDTLIRRNNYHDKSMSQGQVINFRNRPDKLPEEANLQKENKCENEFLEE